MKIEMDGNLLIFGIIFFDCLGSVSVFLREPSERKKFHLGWLHPRNFAGCQYGAVGKKGAIAR